MRCTCVVYRIPFKREAVCVGQTGRRVSTRLGSTTLEGTYSIWPSRGARQGLRVTPVFEQTLVHQRLKGKVDREVAEACHIKRCRGGMLR